MRSRCASQVCPPDVGALFRYSVRAEVVPRSVPRVRARDTMYRISSGWGKTEFGEEVVEFGAKDQG
jgi:hypothetical protein